MNLNKGLVGYWTMDRIDGGKVRDSSANDNHGEIVNSPKAVDGFLGGQALEFEGEDEYVEMPFKDPGQEISVRSIFKSDQSSGEGSIVFGTGTNNDGDSHKWGIFIQNGNVRLSIWTEEGSQQVVYEEPLDSDAWHTYTLTYDGVTAKAYRDGEEVASRDLNETIRDGVNYIMVGGHTPNDWYASGVIDDVRIYERALTGNEVQRLYQMRNPSVQVSNAPERSDLVLYLDAGNRRSYDPDQEEDRWYDLSGNGFEAHGTTGEGSLEDSEFPERTPENGGSFDFAGTYGLNVPGPLPDSDELTIEVWMKRKDLTDSSNYISDARNGNGTWHLTNYPDYSTEDDPVRHINIRWRLEADDPFEEDEDGNASTPESNWWDRWTHIVFMSDGSESRLYVDGGRINDERLKNDDPFSTGLGEDFAIGNRYTGSSPLDGKIGIFRVYNRALPDKQVKMNYRAEKNRFNK